MNDLVTGGCQDFVRNGIPPEQVVGTAGATKFAYTSDGKPYLTKKPKLILNDNNAGKPEGVHLMIGRRPYAAFGNSTGDRQMLEWTGAGARRAAEDACAARRRHPRVRLRAGARSARRQGRHFHPRALRRSEEQRLDGDQHEERLEAHLRVRIVPQLQAHGVNRQDVQ
jgi:hypothetical protein